MKTESTFFTQENFRFGKPVNLQILLSQYEKHALLLLIIYSMHGV